VLFVQLFRDALNEYAYNAEIAGLGYSLNSTAYGVSVSLLMVQRFIPGTCLYLNTIVIYHKC